MNNKMTGTLELLCGPSGVGKTTSIEGVVKSYRWTTRDIRGGEIDSRKFDGSASTHGFFVTEEEFLERDEKGELCGVHKYPHPNMGDWYGFPIAEIKEALERGEQLSEQIVAYRPIENIEKALGKENIKKSLVLANLQDIEERLKERNPDEQSKRNRYAVETTETYLRHMDEFDDVEFNIPNFLLSWQKDMMGRSNLLTGFMSELYDRGYEPVFYNPEVVDRFGMFHSSEGGIELSLFKDAYALFCLYFELGRGKEAYQWIDNVLCLVRDGEGKENPITRRITNTFEGMSERIEAYIKESRNPKRESIDFALIGLNFMHRLREFGYFYDKMTFGPDFYISPLHISVDSFQMFHIMYHLSGIGITSLGESEEKLEKKKKSLEDRMDACQERLAVISQHQDGSKFPDWITKEGKVSDLMLPSHAASIHQYFDRFLLCYSHGYPEFRDYLPVIKKLIGSFETDTTVVTHQGRYFTYILNDFLENLIRIENADREEPNSHDNIKTYPVFSSDKEFLRTYIPYNIPVADVSMRSIKANLERL